MAQHAGLRAGFGSSELFVRKATDSLNTKTLSDIIEMSRANLGRPKMAKQKTYTVPLTLRLTPTMMEFVQQQALEKGVAVVDWIRFAIAFTYWEEQFVRNYERWHTPGWKPGDKPPPTDQHDFDYLPEFETACEEYENSKSQTNLARQARIARLGTRKR